MAGFRDEFLFTFRKFMTPDSLLEKLFNRLGSSTNASATLIRVVSILKTWIREYPGEWWPECELIAKLESLIENSSHKDYFNKYLQLSKLVTSNIKDTSLMNIFKGPLNLYRITTQGRLFKETPATVLAEQFTYIDKEYYEIVPCWELFLWSTTKISNRVIVSPNLARYIDRYQETLNWVTTGVVTETSRTVRAEIITKFIEVGKEALNLHNYSLLMAIFESLSRRIIRHLPLTWELVPDDSKKIYTSWIKYCDPEDNYEAIRTLIESSAKESPCIPFLDGYIQEMNIIDRREPDYYLEDTPSPLINFTKLRQMSSIIQGVKQCDPKTYQLKIENDVLDSIKRLHTITTDAIKAKLAEYAERSEPLSDIDSDFLADECRLLVPVKKRVEPQISEPSPPLEEDDYSDLDNESVSFALQNDKTFENESEEEESFSIRDVKSEFNRWVPIKDGKLESNLTNLSPEDENDMKRARIVQEMLESEEKYVNFLSILVEHGLNPLRDEKVLSETEIRTIFSNVDSILKFHRIFLEDLKTRVSDWKPESLITTVFTQYYQYFRLYVEFVNNFEASDGLLNRLLRRNTRLVKQQDKILQKTGKLDFASLLIMPVQKVPRYVLLLKEYQRKLNPSHPEEKVIVETIDNMEKISSHINTSKRDSEQRAKAVLLGEGRILGYHKEVLKPGRDYKDEIDIHIIYNGGTVRACAVIWSDVIMICKPKDGKKKLHFMGNIKPVGASYTVLTTKEFKSLLKDNMTKELKKELTSAKSKYVISLEYLSVKFIIAFTTEKNMQKFIGVIDAHKLDTRNLKVCTEPNAPSGENSAIAVIENNMYAYGGLIVTGLNSVCGHDLYSFNMDEYKWTIIQADGDCPPSLTEHSLVSYHGELYLFGGHNLGDFKNDFYKFSPHSKIWEKIDTVGDPPSPRSGHSAVVDVNEGKMYIIGGFWFQHVTSPKYYNEIYSYHFATSTWQKEAVSNKFTPRRKHVSELIENKIYVYGGITTSDRYLNDTCIYDLETKTMSQCLGVHGAIPTHRHSSSSASYGQKMVVYGGVSSSFLKDLYIFDTTTFKWSLCWTPFDMDLRKNHTSVIFGNEMYIFGGRVMKENQITPNDVTVINNITTLIWRALDYNTKAQELRKKSEKLMRYGLPGNESVYYPIVEKPEVCIHTFDNITSPSTEFTLLEKIGEGPNGEVYKALHVESSTPVAIKVIPLKNLVKDAGLLIEHIQMLKTFNHSSFIRYHDAVVHENDIWIISDLCENVKSLKEYLNGPPPRVLSERLTSVIISITLEALMHLHRLDLNHGLLKASNVFLQSDGTIKLGDYSISQFLKVSDVPDSLKDKAEQGSDKADVWSLGLFVIEMLENNRTGGLSRKCSNDTSEFVLMCLNSHVFKRPMPIDLYIHSFCLNSIHPKRRIEVLKEITDFIKPKRLANRISIMDLGSRSKDSFRGSGKIDDHCKDMEILKMEVEHLKRENEELKQKYDLLEERLAALEKTKSEVKEN